MASFGKGVNEEDVNKDGTWRVRIRVTHKRISKYISTEYYLTRKQLTKDFEIKDQHTLDKIEDQIRSYRKKVTELSTTIDVMSCEQLKQYLIKPDIQKVDYIAFSRSFIEKLKAKGTRDNARGVLNSFVDLVGPSMEINEVSIVTINKYVDFIRSERTVTRSNNPGVTYKLKLKPVSDTGEKDYLTRLKQFYTQAMKHYNDRNSILIPYNPFVNYEAPKPATTKARNTSPANILTIRDCPDFKISKFDRGQVMIRARDAFMLSFYLIGMNAVDLFYADQYEAGRISYKRAKTSSRRDDGAFISIKIEPEAMDLFEKYRDPSGERVFIFHKWYADHDCFTDTLNRGLKKIIKFKKINDPITFYWARYSWINIARNDCDVSKEDVAEAVNHSDPDHKTTDIYLTKVWTRIDKANRKVLDKILSPVYDSEEAEDHAEFTEYFKDHPDELNEIQ